MKRYGKFLTEETIDTDKIIATTSDNIYTDEVLRARGYYPIEEVGDQHQEADSRIFKYSLVNDESGGYMEQRAYVVPVDYGRVYSKLKILINAQKLGFIDRFVQLLNSSVQLKLIWDASNVIENNELLSQYLPEIARVLNKSEQELHDFLNTYCIAD